MKKVFAIMFALAMTVLSANAQSYEMPKNELSVGVGYGTHPHIAIGFGDIFAGIITGDIGDENSYGAYNVQYLHNFGRHFALGATCVYEHIYKDSKKGNNYKEDFLTIMPTIKTNWFRGKAFGMYSRVGAGVSLNHYNGYGDSNSKSGTDTYFAFQVSPVCFEAGSNKVAGFLELGYGYQGIVSAGLKFGF